ncbi:MAG TPA: S8 family serine peptidase [Thermoanaerobaculia bacterium]|nr:S8 family serine peptidase [Thermoanaerobaculia bacterium]
MSDSEKASLNNPPLTFTDRTVLAFADDVGEAQLEEFRSRLPQVFGERIPNLLERTLMIPRLKVIVTPVSYDLLAEQLGSLDLHGVVAHAPERVSFVRPGNKGMISRARTVKTPLGVMGVTGSTKTGKDIRVAMLDTGFDVNHIDFKGRNIIPLPLGADVRDLDGHGTHTTGLACGPSSPPNGTPRYGVAYESTILPIRVFNSFGATTDGIILDAIALAMANDAVVIAMCLASGVALDTPYSTAFEKSASGAAATCVLIAPAGDDPAGDVYPVCHPANCPSVMAVAGLGEDFGAWEYSCGQRNADGEVNISAPGYEILSSVPGDQHEPDSGTSMSAAYVAGIAALWAQTGLRGPDLRAAVEGSFTKINASPKLVGNGLVKAPA